MKMTLEEICAIYGYSENSLKTNFRRTSESFRKKYGLDLIKCSSYRGTYYEVSSPRALTMYEEIKNEIYIPLETIKMDDLVCLVFIGVAATPQGVFRGSRKDFLDYIGLKHSKRNIDLLNIVLDSFIKKEGSPLICQEDEDYIILYIERNFEKRQTITINMLRICQEIAQKNNKQTMKIIQLLKVFQAYRINEAKGVNPLTNKDIKDYVDLSEKQIRDVRRLLEREGVIKTNRVGDANKCYGTEFAINAFVDSNKNVIGESAGV